MYALEVPYFSISPVADSITILLGLFNLRGSDIAYNPVFFAYALVTQTEAILYVDAAKLSDQVRGTWLDRCHIRELTKRMFRLNHIWDPLSPSDHTSLSLVICQLTLASSKTQKSRRLAQPSLLFMELLVNDEVIETMDR